MLDSPTNQLRNKDSFNYAKEIIKEFGMIEAILNWSKTELTDEWRWQLVEMSHPKNPGRYIFYFDSERDYVAFLLKWA